MLHEGVEIWRTKDGSEIAVLAATWELRPTVTFESLAEEFRANPVKAWRNYGSRVDLAVEAAIKDTAAVLGHCNLMRPDPWNHTFEDFAAWFRGRPGRRYFLHFDLAKNRDAVGIGLVHREKTGVVEVDFAHRIVTRLGKDINFAALREQFVYGLMSRGFHLQLITYDQWQSEESRQILTEKGFETDLCSADRTSEPYDTLIEMLLTSRLDYYNHPIFIREMEELRFVNGMKYDHPKKTRTGQPGSKDVSDAVACATFKAIQYELDNPAPPPGTIRVIRNPALTPRYEKGAW